MYLLLSTAVHKTSRVTYHEVYVYHTARHNGGDNAASEFEISIQSTTAAVYTTAAVHSTQKILCTWYVLCCCRTAVRLPTRTAVLLYMEQGPPKVDTALLLYSSSSSGMM